jgi:hypothetical protein
LSTHFSHFESQLRQLAISFHLIITRPLSDLKF